MQDIICYTLNRQFRAVRFGGTNVGFQEFGEDKAKTLDLSDSLIALANSKTLNLKPQSIAKIIAVLYRSGFLFVDTAFGEAPDYAVRDLLAVKDTGNLIAVLKRYIFSVVSPLLYTRLLADIEDQAEILYTNQTLKGRLYELAVKAEDIAQRGYMEFPCSYYYQDASGQEIDLITKCMAFEATVETKAEGNFIVDSFELEHKMIRVLTDVEGVSVDDAHYNRIAYPDALLALSSGAIYNLSMKLGK